MVKKKIVIDLTHSIEIGVEESFASYKGYRRGYSITTEVYDPRRWVNIGEISGKVPRRNYFHRHFCKEWNTV